MSPCLPAMFRRIFSRDTGGSRSSSPLWAQQLTAHTVRGVDGFKHGLQEKAMYVQRNFLWTLPYLL